MTQLTFGSLFAGIGGFDLGLERAGMRCVWQVERDDFCQRVLAKHWPDVRRHDDVTTFPPDDGTDWRCDLVCGGFPCQDVSYAGRGAGLDGARSGLWAEYARVVRLLRPRLVLVENVPALPDRGFGRVLGSLAACGYDAEWDCLPASAFGAPHQRDRLFLFAYGHGDQLRGSIFAGGSPPRDRQWAHTQDEQAWHRRFAQLESVGVGARMDTYADARGILDGIPERMDRVRSLGNAVVPAVAEWLGRRILAAHHHHP